MGDCSCPSEAASHASHYELHVRKLATDFLDHDGLHAIQLVVSIRTSLPSTDTPTENPIQGIINTNAAFSKFESESTKSKMWGVKVVYILMQCLLLGLGVYKVNGMGLLPTTRSDWLAWETEREPLERAYFAFE